MYTINRTSTRKSNPFDSAFAAVATCTGMVLQTGSSHPRRGGITVTSGYETELVDGAENLMIGLSRRCFQARNSVYGEARKGAIPGHDNVVVHLQALLRASGCAAFACCERFLAPSAQCLTEELEVRPCFSLAHVGAVVGA
jgi:hypothetical protein